MTNKFAEGDLSHDERSPSAYITVTLCPAKGHPPLHHATGTDDKARPVAKPSVRQLST